MNRQQLAKEIRVAIEKRLQGTADAPTLCGIVGVLEGLAEVAGTELGKGGAFAVPGIGRLRVRASAPRPARTGRNPLTGEPVAIPERGASFRIAFAPHGPMLDRVLKAKDGC